MSDGGSYPSAEQCAKTDKIIKKLVRKQIKSTLAKLLEKSLFEDKYDKKLKICGSKQEEEQRLDEAITLYGTLTNSVTKESDLIFKALNSFHDQSRLIYYTVSNKDLFKVFPAAGTYLGPYQGCKPVFVEVLAQVEDFYICKAATQLRYLELLSMKGEKKV